jgi:pSer/pThr/pTyr-binding forkhead associated (FHA) protein
MTHLRLFVCDGTEVAEQTFSRFPIRIGRHPQNECQLHDVSVSRFHVQVDSGSRGITLRDLGSRNGTVILEGPSNRRLQGASDRFGDSVRFVVGNVHVLARLEDETPNAIPDEVVRVLRDASADLFRACVRRGFPNETGVRNIFDALYRNLFSVRTALQSSDASEDPVYPEPMAARSEPVAAMLKWAQTTSVALRLLEHALDGHPASSEPSELASAPLSKEGV